MFPDGRTYHDILKLNMKNLRFFRNRSRKIRMLLLNISLEICNLHGVIMTLVIC